VFIDKLIADQDKFYTGSAIHRVPLVFLAAHGFERFSGSQNLVLHAVTFFGLNKIIVSLHVVALRDLFDFASV